MTEHLPECLAFGKCDDPDCFHGKPICICDALRSCEERALDDAVQRVEASADDPNSGVDWNWDYEADVTGMTRNPRVWIREAVAAIRNEVK